MKCKKKIKFNISVIETTFNSIHNLLNILCVYHFQSYFKHKPKRFFPKPIPSNLFPPSIPEQLKGDDYSTREKGSEFPWERLTPDLFLDAPLCPLIKAPP